MKNNYINNISSILNDGSIENKPLKNIDILKSILMDDNVGNLLYKGFENDFNSSNNDVSDLYCKTEDLIYRMNLLVNEYLIPNHNLNDVNSIKEVIKDLIDKGADFYSAVSFDDTDNEIIEEYNLIYSDVGVSI